MIGDAATAGARSVAPDALIIGAGIQGATLAWEMARRGLRALLIDPRPPASGNTAASFGLLHGGLRYLQQFDLPRWLRSRREQQWFVKTLPSLVRGLPVVMPLYRGAPRSPQLFRTAFALESLAARVLHPDGLPLDGIVARDGALLPGYPIVRDGLAGCARWNEYVLSDATAAVQRLLADAGAPVLQAQARALRVARGQAVGVELQGQRDEDLAAPIVILCAGAASRSLAGRFDRDLARLSSGILAFNLLLDRPAPRGAALAVSSRPGRGRSLFLRAEGDALLAGTWYAPAPDAPGGARIDASQAAKYMVDSAIDELRACVPALDISRRHLLAVHAGYLPAADKDGRRLRKRDALIEHAAFGGPRGLWSVLGVKLTTAHALSARAVDRIWPDRSPAFDPLIGSNAGTVG